MRRGEKLIGLLLLAAFLFGPVMIGLFQRPAMLFGAPALLVYVFAAWGLVIALLARIARGGDRDGEAP
jgi:hypothetical protein